MHTIHILSCLLMFSTVTPLPDVNLLPDRYSQSVLCAKHIVTHYFNQNYPISIRHIYNGGTSNFVRKLGIPEYHDYMLSDIIVKELTCTISWPGIIWHKRTDAMKQQWKSTPRENPLQLIIIVTDSVDDFGDALMDLWWTLYFYFDQDLSTNSNIVIFLPVKTKQVKEICKFLFHYIHFAHIYNIVLISAVTKHSCNDVPSTCEDQFMYKLYTWFPFKNPHQCGGFQGMTLLDRWNQNGSRKFEYESNLFPPKLPKIFYGCTLFYSRTGYYNKGSKLEWFLLENLFNSLHVKAVKSSKLADVYLFKTANLILNELASSKYGTTLHANVIFPHLYKQVHCYVPCPKLYI